MLSWGTYQRAAAEYSRLCPRQIVSTLTPVAGQKVQALPAGAISVRYLAYGERISFIEAATDESSAQGWNDEGNQLILTPAPTDTTALTIIYQGYHLADEQTQSFPTIPAAHLPYVDDLELANALESDARDTLLGPVNYQIGQTVIDRSLAPAEMRALARDLRRRVAEALEEPLALWQ